MMRSARLRFPSNINLLVKRATLRLLYFASGTSGRRTTFLRLGTVCLLNNELTWYATASPAGACMVASPVTGRPQGSPLLWTASQADACMVAKERFFPFTQRFH